jgi:uncharacterized protein DUF1153
MRSDGTRITLAQLPPIGLTPSSRDEKIILVAAVLHGLITLSDACKRYCLSIEVYVRRHRCLAPDFSDGTLCLMGWIALVFWLYEARERGALFLTARACLNYGR